MKLKRIAKERKQTLVFLELAKNVPGVTLVTEIAITKQGENKVNLTAALVKAISRAMQKCSDLNVQIKFGTRDRLLALDDISARITVEKQLNGVNGVYSCIIKDTDQKSLDQIHHELDEIKRSDVANDKRYALTRLIHRLPLFLSIYLSKLLLFFTRKQAAMMGSFTVTSFGERSQFFCVPISGSTFTFTLGNLKKRESQPTEATHYVANLVMVFDHRVLDGMSASLFLNRIKNYLSEYLQEGGR
ncbi:dihydrolipoamide succinyltransferase [Affinibrenneria salicis]|uniref:Dihydrolipoamide succinyltransferase n=1 Tax=Affinibrenneria salicis TaxID=2590031 RepID=A0A5J5FQF0_9GAMM|nr:2-oxo acid dehydrogenase subunit E2 [Affinibrenneria salicis]KAA8995160.1 dihydrolipoamide succinyltransferase [Affinibrenneria salicis]